MACTVGEGLVIFASLSCAYIGQTLKDMKKIIPGIKMCFINIEYQSIKNRSLAVLTGMPVFAEPGQLVRQKNY